MSRPWQQNIQFGCWLNGMYTSQYWYYENTRWVHIYSRCALRVNKLKPSVDRSIGDKKNRTVPQKQTYCCAVLYGKAKTGQQAKKTNIEIKTTLIEATSYTSQSATRNREFKRVYICVICLPGFVRTNGHLVARIYKSIQDEVFVFNFIV